MADHEIRTRQCPMCDSIHRKTVIELSAREIIAANWSYRADQLNDQVIGDNRTYTLDECTDCGFVYAGSLPDEDFLAWVYDRLIDTDAARTESFSPSNMANRMAYLATLIRLIGEPGKVLDYGCGFGPTLSLLEMVHGVSAVGFETSAKRIDELRRRHHVILQNHEIVRANGPYAAIILDNVLEHVPVPRQTIDFLGRICTDGGILLVSVPNMSKRHLASQIEMNRRRLPLAMDMNPWEHLNCFDTTYLDRLLSQHGFTALKQAAIPGPIGIGLRPSSDRVSRIKNGFASLLRLAAYAWLGDTMATPNLRFYRRAATVSPGSNNA